MRGMTPKVRQGMRVPDDVVNGGLVFLPLIRADLPAALFARFLVMFSRAEGLEDSFPLNFLLEPSQGFFKGLIVTNQDLWHRRGYYKEKTGICKFRNAG